MNTMPRPILNAPLIPPGQWSAGQWVHADPKTDPDRRPDPRDLPWVDKVKFEQWKRALEAAA